MEVERVLNWKLMGHLSAVWCLSWWIVSVSCISP